MSPFSNNYSDENITSQLNDFKHDQHQIDQIFVFIHEFGMPFLALLTFLLRIMCIIIFSIPIKLPPPPQIQIQQNLHQPPEPPEQHQTTSYTIINRYLLLNSIFEAFISLAFFLLPFIYFSRTISLPNSYFTKWYYVYVITYGANLSSMLSIIANCMLCFYRYTGF